MCGTTKDEPAAGGCCGHTASADSSATARSGETVECPVMEGVMVVKADAEEAGLVRDYAGQRYWLCCESCGPLFDADPAEYAHA